MVVVLSFVEFSQHFLRVLRVTGPNSAGKFAKSFPPNFLELEGTYINSLSLRNTARDGGSQWGGQG